MDFFFKGGGVDNCISTNGIPFSKWKSDFFPPRKDWKHFFGLSKKKDFFEKSLVQKRDPFPRSLNCKK